jgi:hypothetical protein
MAYINGAQHGVKYQKSIYSRHDLEKSDVFSMGLSFLQMTLLLSEQELVSCNDPKFVTADGTIIDCSHDTGNATECPGYMKMMGFVRRVPNKVIQTCLVGMLNYNETARSSWFQAHASIKDHTEVHQPLVERTKDYQIKDLNNQVFQNVQSFI